MILGLARRLLIVAALVVAGCASDPTGGSVEPTAAPEPSPSVQPPVPLPTAQPVDLSERTLALSAERRLGEGWAVAASSVPGATIVATTAGVWRVASTGAAEPVPSVLDGDVRDVRASADGRFVALLSDRGSAEIIEMSTLEQFAVFDEAEEVWFRTDGTLITSHPTALRHISLTDGSVVAELAVDDGESIVAATADERTAVVAIAGETGVELIWWIGAGDFESIPLDVQDGVAVEQLALTTDEHRVAVGTFDRTGNNGGEVGVVDLVDAAYVWRAPTQNAALQSNWMPLEDGGVVVVEGQEFETHDRAGDVVSSGELPGGAADVARVGSGWAVNTATGRLAVVSAAGAVTVIPGSYGLVTDFEPTNDGLIVVSGTGRVEMLDAGGELGELDFVPDRFVGAPLNDVAIASSGMLATAASNGVAEVWSADDASVQLPHPEGNVDAVVFSTPADEIITGIAQRRAATSFDDTVVFWDLASSTPTRRATLRGEVEPVAGCAFFDSVIRMSPDATMAAASSHDFTVSLFSVEEAVEVHVFAPHGGAIYDIAMSTDGAQMATAADDSTLRLYDLGTYDLRSEIALERSILAMAFLPDGRLVASDLLGEVFVVDPATGERTASFEGTKQRTSRVAVSNDGARVAAGGDGSVVQVWTTDSGLLEGVGIGHSGPVTSVAFDATGSQLVSGSQDGTAILWQLEPV